MQLTSRTKPSKLQIDCPIIDATSKTSKLALNTTKMEMADDLGAKIIKALVKEKVQERKWG